MAEAEFRDIFQHELVKYCRGSSDLPNDTPSVNELELQRMAELMMNGVVQRMRDRAACLPEESGQTESPQVAAGPSLRHRLEEECRDLDTQIEQTHAATARLRTDMLERVDAGLASIAQHQERQLIEVHRAAASQPDPADSDGFERASQIEQRVAKVSETLQEMRLSAKALMERKHHQEKVEAQQCDPLMPVEEMLAQAGKNNRYLDISDEALLEAIRKGENACKRLRHHLAGS